VHQATIDEMPQNNFVSPGGSQDSWLISTHDFAQKVIPSLLKCILPDRKELAILIPGVGLDTSCFEIEKHDSVGSIDLVDLDEASCEFFRSFSDKKDGDGKECRSTLITEKIMFHTNWDSVMEKKFDVVLDKSFFDVLEANLKCKQAEQVWKSCTYDLLNPNGVCLILSMNLQRVQQTLRNTSIGRPMYFSVLFGNNQYIYQSTGKRARKRIGLISMGLAFGSSNIVKPGMIRNFTVSITDKFKNNEPSMSAFTFKGNSLIPQTLTFQRILYTDIGLQSRENT
jgi:hypothetical protein